MVSLGRKNVWIGMSPLQRWTGEGYAGRVSRRTGIGGGGDAPSSGSLRRRMLYGDSKSTQWKALLCVQAEQVNCFSQGRSVDLALGGIAVVDAKDENTTTLFTITGVRSMAHVEMARGHIIFDIGEGEL